MNRIAKVRLLVFVLLSLVFFGCSSESKKEHGRKVPEKGGETATAEKTLVLFNYDEYIGSATLEDFRKRTGIDVELVTYDTEEDMVAAVQSNPGAYDVIVVSGDTARELIAAKILGRLDGALLSNLTNIDPRFLHREWDPQQQYLVPYLYGTSGIVVNTKYVSEYEKSWKLLWDERYAGKIAMLENSFETFAVAQKMLGHSIQSRDPEDYEMAKAALFRQKPLLHGYFPSVKMLDLMREEKVWGAHIYNGDGLMLADENASFAFFVPEEGAPLWVDHFAITRNARNREAAHLFLNYMLEPEVNARIASELWYASPNRAAQELIDPEVLASPGVNPPPEILAKSEFFSDMGELTRLVQSIWNELQMR